MPERLPVLLGPQAEFCKLTNGLCNRDGKCQTSVEFLNKSTTGGQASLTEEARTGSYWPEKKWDDYYSRTIGISAQCSRQPYLFQLLAEVDNDKRERGEI